MLISEQLTSVFQYMQHEFCLTYKIVCMCPMLLEVYSFGAGPFGL